MNPSSRFESIKLRVGQENEEFFNDNFWTGLNFVVNAVDNVKARQYVDQQCVWYEKPLFESGREKASFPLDWELDKSKA